MDNAKLKNKLTGKLQSQSQQTDTPLQETQPAEEVTTAVVESSTALSAIKSDYIALTTDALSIISENLKNQQLSPALFDVIKSPSGGTTVFTVPTISGEEIEKELAGIILGYTTPRAYWDTPDPKEGTPPI